VHAARRSDVNCFLEHATIAWKVNISAMLRSAPCRLFFKGPISDGIFIRRKARRRKSAGTMKIDHREMIDVFIACDEMGRTITLPGKIFFIRWKIGQKTRQGRHIHTS